MALCGSAALLGVIESAFSPSLRLHLGWLRAAHDDRGQRDGPLVGSACSP